MSADHRSEPGDELTRAIEASLRRTFAPPEDVAQALDRGIDAQASDRGRRSA